MSPSSSSDSESDSINAHIKKAQRLKKMLDDESASDSDSESSESSEGSEDEDGNELTPAVDAAILRTLAKIKRRDPEIYDSKTSVFQAEQKRTSNLSMASRTKDKSKPVHIKEAYMQSALRAGSRTPSPEPVPHVVEQANLRSETIAAFHSAVNEDEEEDDLLVPREKTKDEREREEDEYRAFLESEVGQDLNQLVTVPPAGVRADTPEEEEQDAMSDSDDEPREGESKSKAKKRKERRAKLKAKLEKPKKEKESDQDFLINYIVNRGWVDKTADRVPTYHEVTKQDDDKGSAESDFDEVNELFENSYNYRFEEPDAAVIQGFPRNLPSTVRREDTTRKDARERRRERKAEEKAKRKEQVKKLQAEKMRKMRALIGKEGGVDYETSKALQDLDLDAEWDPDAHDHQMADLYGADGEFDDEKPTWDDDIDMGDIQVPDDDQEGYNTIEPEVDLKALKREKKKEKKKKKKKGAEEDGVVDIDAMDADVVQEEEEEEWDGTEEMRKRKVQEYLDEIYALEFNDMVGDMPTRFKYASVAPSSYSLTPAEILMATDAELNQYMGVKKYAPYRKEPRWDPTRADRLKEFKSTVGERLPALAASTSEVQQPAVKRKGKKERMKLKAEAEAVEEAGATGKRKREEVVESAPTAVGNDEAEDSKAKRRRKRQKKAREAHTA